MNHMPEPANIRKGRFLWMADDAKRNFINELKHRIAEGFYFSEPIYAKIVDELAPVLNESTEGE